MAIMIRPSLAIMAMMGELSFALVINSFFFSFYINTVESVPEDYCFSPLNKSDCGLPPTPVFTHYREGSRCEIEMWRGCPTENLFNNEYHCSHHCIGKLRSSEQVVKVKETLLGSKCDVPIDTSLCTLTNQQVYTYDDESQKCIKVTYYGCPTENKFRNQKECEAICQKTKNRWEQDVKNLDIDELKKIDDMLDEIYADSEPSKPEKEDLKKTVVSKKFRPHTISDEGETTEPPEQITKPEEVKDKSEEPIDKIEEDTDKPEETSTGEANEANTVTVRREASTFVQKSRTDKSPKYRTTKKIPEGHVVRNGLKE